MRDLPLSELSDIAIIGMAGRFPGAQDIHAFWQNLRDGVESIYSFSVEELDQSLDPAVRQNPHYVRASGVLTGVEQFDAFFFGYSPGEAALMDPQQRLLLECAWEALEDAGYDPNGYPGLIGVFAGAGMNTYVINNLSQQQSALEPGRDYQMMIANDKDFLATRISYKLNLKGPGVTVQTACSTSLVAVHLACQSLRSGECDIALAGGVSIRIPQQAGYLYQEGMILSPDGHCRAFDAQAQGTVIGSGLGIVVLKLLADALADGDHLYAVIKGSTINNDGALKAGYTAPALDAQAAVIFEAQSVAGVTADTISYVEAHGTGTAVGDPIEIAALSKAFRFSTDKKQYCALGSVKTNIGHLDAAAGIAGLMKTILALQHKQIPPNLNFQTPNPRIDFAETPFYVNTSLQSWRSQETPRRAGVSSFGIGGTNAHLILEEVPTAPWAPDSTRPWQLLILSAKTMAALDQATINLGLHLAQHPDIPLADIAYTLHVGRQPFGQRRFVVCRTLEEATTALTGQNPQCLFTAVNHPAERSVAFMFTGQGAQYVTMGQELYQTEPVFRQHVDTCCALLQPHLKLDLRTILFPPASKKEEAANQLLQTALTQPALFVIEYALAQLWMSWGLRPQALIGHSIGEYVAACLAGVFSPADALLLVAARGRLMQAMPAGSMLAVPLPEAAIKPLLNPKLSLAAVNTPSLCVISGVSSAVDLLQAQLTEQGVSCRRLHTSHAFHSAMMDPVLDPFAQQVRQVVLQPPQLPCISNVTGTWLTPAQATDPAYWAQQIRQTVRFADGLEQLVHDPALVLLEVGPGQTLSVLARRHPHRAQAQLVLNSLPPAQDQQAGASFLLTTLGRLWLAGVPVDWAGFHASERRQRLSLPTYPFERQRCWVEAQPATKRATAVVQAGSVKEPEIADWFYAPSWQRSVATPQLPGSSDAAAPASWLIFADEVGLGAALVQQLQQQQEVMVVKVGATFAQIDTRTYTIDPDQPADYERLIQIWQPRPEGPRHIVYLWSLTKEKQSQLAQWEEIQTLNFGALLFLAQSLANQSRTAEVQLTVVTNHLQEVMGEEIWHPARAILSGPVHIIPHEYPHIQCQMVDIELSPAAGERENHLADRLLTEIHSSNTEPVVAYRGGHRWVRRFEPVCLGSGELVNQRLRQRGVYLITGGLGGVGLTLAHYLAEAVSARLILLSRTPFPPVEEWETWLSTHGEDNQISRRIGRLQAIQAVGGECHIVCADVTNESQMQTIITQSIARLGAVNGVIHAAGVPGGQMILSKTAAGASQVMAPKVKGALILASVLAREELDFFILCSSLNAVVGRIGQIDYSAANAFLDTFAQAHTLPPGTFVASIGWETWQEVGMAARAATATAHAAVPVVAHPFLDGCVLANETTLTYMTHVEAKKHWALYEHGVIGKPTLPGTAYLELVRAVLANHMPSETIEFQDVHFVSPLTLAESEAKVVYTVLNKRGTGFEFVIASQAAAERNSWQEHARGRVSWRMDIPAVAACDRPALADRCQEQYILEPLQQKRLGNFYLQQKAAPGGEAFAAPWLMVAETDEPSPTHFMSFGPHWQCLVWVRLGAGEGLACLELPAAFRAEVATYRLHPALLDFATSFLRLFKSTGSYLPLSYKRLLIRRPLPTRLYSYARYTPGTHQQGFTLSFDITLFDEQGEVLVEIEEFSVIKVQDIEKLNTTTRSHLPPNLFLPQADAPLTSSALAVSDNLQTGMTPTEGVEVFRRVLSSTLPHVVISTYDLAKRQAQAYKQSLGLLAGSVAEDDPQKTRHPRPALPGAYAPPQTRTQEKLAAIWQAVLSIEQVGIHDNFFELGGDSLLITQIYSQFQQNFEYDISIAKLLQYPTIADLAAFLQQSASEEPLTFTEIAERTSKQKAARQRRGQAMAHHRNKLAQGEKQ